MTRRIRVQSSALGFPARVDVYVYPTLEAMRTAAKRYSPTETFDDAYGVTHCTTIQRIHPDQNAGPITARPIIRLHAGNLGTEAVAHEMIHAATAIYGAHLDPDTPARDVLHNHDEPFAYLYGELLRRLVNRLYHHGYYTKEAA